MISCILAFYIACAASLAADETVESGIFSAVQDARTLDPDALYARRDEMTSAHRAEEVWQQRLTTNPRDFESAWKLARARFWIGQRTAGAQGKAVLETGIAAARTAVRIEPGRPEGHFWLAANMGALAESFGMRQGLKYRGEIRNELMTVLRLDPAFQQGSADRALGRWYFKVPGLFGGSRKKSEEHLRRSLTYAPHSTASHFYLAELLLEAGRRDEARAELQRVIDAPFDPDWTPEDREFKQKANKLLESLRPGWLPLPIMAILAIVAILAI
jgi:tetratricopeptide (TPR) repeat protein